MKTTTVLATAMALATLTATTTALAAATTCNGACPENLKPLCGSDGVTYDNECMLEFARCTAANAGKAPLTLVSAGPCGSNSATLTPAPSAECAKIMCLQMIDPVCGSDGKTYNSACELKQAQCDNAPTLTVKSKGECPPAGGGGGDAGSGNGNGACKPTMCTKEYKPVCGSDNKTYSNKCEFTNAQCTAASATPAAAKLTLKAETACDAASSVGNDTGASKLDGSAGSSADCVQAVCTREMAPVCGSDGVTYNNACLFANAKCTDATLTQVATGACSDSTATPPAPSTPSGGAASLQVSLVAAVVLSAIASLAC